MKTKKVIQLLAGLTLLYFLWLNLKPQLPISWVLSTATRLQVRRYVSDWQHLKIVADIRKQDDPNLFQELAYQSRSDVHLVIPSNPHYNDICYVRIYCSRALRILGYPDRIDYYYYPNQGQLGFYHQWVYVPNNFKMWIQNQEKAQSSDL